MNRILYLLAISFLFSLPRYSIEEATNCMSCHINPSGGGMRNDYGSNIYSLDELPLKKWLNKGNQDWDGFVSDDIQIGGDFRIQMFQNGEKNRIFPMQADLYSNVQINNFASLYFKLDLSRRLTDEYYVMFDDVLENSWFKVGQSLPNYGLKIDDHTSFTRSGNYNSLFIEPYDINYDEGLFFDVDTSLPIILEYGVKLNKTTFTSSIGTNYITNAQRGFKNFAFSIHSYHSLSDLNMLTGVSYMKEEDVESYAVFGGVNVNKLSFLYEFDKVDNWLSYNNGQNTDFYSSYANLLQFTYKAKQGLHLIMKFDYFDKDINSENGDVLRKTFGIELYPLNMFEIDFLFRQNTASTIEIDNDKKNEFLMQVHSWF